MATHTRNLRFRMKEYLPALQSRQMTNREAAALLGVHEEHLCRMLAEVGFKKEPPANRVDRETAKRLAAEKKAFRTLVANTMTPEDAAKAANVSVRTIYRYIAK